MRKALKWFGRGFLAVVLLVVVVLVGGRYWIQTDSGLALLAGQAEPAGIRLEGVTGDPLGRLKIDRIEVLDDKGAWLVVEDAVLAWRPWRLIRREVLVEGVEARRISVLRAPESDPNAPPPEPSEPFSPPAIRLALEKLAVEEIVLDPALAGIPARLSVVADALYAKGAASAAIEIQRLDQPGRLDLAAAYVLDDNSFDIDLELDEPPGGLATAMAGLQDGASARLKGAGDLSGWQGKLSAASGTAPLIDLDIKVQREAEDILAAIAGDIRPNLLTPPDARDLVAKLVGDALGLDVKLRAATDGSVIAAERVSLKAAAADLELSGQFAPETGALQADVRTTRVDDAILRDLAPDIAIEGPSLTASASGALDALKAEADIRLASVAAGDAGARGLKLLAQAAVGRDGGIEWTATANAEAAQIGAPAVDEVLAGAWRVVASGSATPDGEVFPVDIEAAGGQGLAASFEGNATASGAVEGRAEAAVADLKALQGLAGVPVTGPATVATDVAFSDAGLRLTGLEARAVGATVAGQAALDGAFANIESAFKVSIRSLSPIGKLVDQPLAGALAGDVTLAGPVSDPSATADIRIDNLRAMDLAFQRATIKANAATLASGPKGDVRIDAASPYGALSAQTAFQMVQEALALRGLVLTAPGARVAGDVQMTLATGAMRGAIDLDITNLKTATAPVGLDLAGAGDGRIRLQGDRADVTLTLRDLEGFGVALQRVTLEANGGFDPSAPVDVSLLAENAALDGASVERLQVDLNGPIQDARLSIETNGRAAEQPFQAAIDGQLSVKPEGQSFRLASGKGQIADTPFEIASGLMLSNGPNGAGIQNFDLASAPARVRLDAALDGDRVSLNLAEASADLARVSELVPGLGLGGAFVASGQIDGTLAQPAGRINFEASNVRAVDMAPDQSFSATGAVALSSDAVRLNVTGEGLGGSPLSIEGRVGLASNGAGPPTVAPNAPINVSVDWNGPLAPIVALAPLDDHRLTGAAIVDLEVSGTVANPLLNGAIRFDNGAYESLEFGTTLTFERIEVLASGREIELTPFTAKAGGGGISASAKATLDPAAGFPFSLEANLANARLAARDDVTANASGDIAVTSDDTGMQVEARIVTDQIEIELIDSLPPSVARLEVTEVGALPPGRKPPPPPKKANEGPPIALDIQVSIPGRLFVRGRGLESEWQGDIAIVGTTDEPAVNGEINLKRGAFDIAGKRLNLSTGVVRLEPDASDRLEAIVDIVAEYEGPDYLIKVGVAGPATDPEVILGATPELPRDEILARLLFGKNAGSLTAAESIQLAAAAASLAGDGGGFDPVGDLRRATGIDTLRIDAGGEGGPTVEAGKYLTDDVYVGVRQGASAGQGAVSVEVEVFDNIIIESEAADDGSQKVGARLKWDY